MGRANLPLTRVKGPRASPLYDSSAMMACRLSCSSRMGNTDASSGSFGFEALAPTPTTAYKAGPGAGDPEAAAVAPPNGTVPSARIDTGWAPWKVVIGCFCLTVPTYGLLSSIGLFQTYWHQHMLQHYSKGDVSWIISVFGFLDCLFAAPSGIFFDRYGPRWLLPLGCVAYIAAFIGLAFSTTYSQLMGCMTLAGVSAATITTVAFSVVSQWFKVRKGLATGCVTLGAPLGGVFFSLTLQALFDKLPWRTAALALAGLMASFLLLGNLLVSANVSSQAASEESESVKVPSMLRSPKFWLISYAVFAYELVLFIQWGSIPSYAVATNFGNIQFYLMMSYNIGALFGRTVAPWLSDRFLGPINTIVVMNAYTLLVVLTIWLPLGASSVSALFVVVVLMGIGTGSFVPLGVSCINSLSNPQSTGTWLGFVYSISSFATLIGNPSSEAILARYESNGLVAFLAAILFSGMISAATLRWVHHERRWIFKAKI